MNFCVYLTLVTLSIHEVMLCDTDVKPDELSGSNFLRLDKEKREILILGFRIPPVPFTL